MSLYKSYFSELQESDSQRVAREAPAAIVGLEDLMREKKPKFPEAVERINFILERNIPTSPDKWTSAKAAARAKFKVYPSAYANLWAAKKYKSMGGGWKKGKK
jgi:hypothetical protein